MQQMQFDSAYALQQGINYIVPMQWWKTYQLQLTLSKNKPPRCPSLAPMDIRPLVETLILDFQQEYVSELTQKSYYLNLTRRILSTPVLPDKELGVDYQIVSSRAYRAIEKGCRPGSGEVAYPVMVFASKEYEGGAGEKVDRVAGMVCPQGEKQLQIILCTKTASFLFIGYVPRNADLLWVVRAILREMELVEVTETKCVFADVNRQLTLNMQHLAGRKACQLLQTQTFLMIINLICPTTDIKPARKPKPPPLQLQLLQLQPLSSSPTNFLHKTISTGASTHLSFFPTQSNEQMREMFQQKSPEEIAEMKHMADVAIESSPITIREITMLQAEEELAGLMEKILEIGGIMHNRKKNKEKELRER